ncbi:MAG: class II aldolase/adducin family protein [Pseudomonadota bacterium]
MRRNDYLKAALLAALTAAAGGAAAQAADAVRTADAPRLGGASPQLVDDLVAASHVLAAHGVVDGFGHVSVRHDKNPRHVLISRSMAPALVTAADIIELDEQCEPVDARAGSPFLERFIHCEIYRERADVQAVVHNHAPEVIPFTVSAVPLRPLYHMSAFLGEGVPVFEIRDHAGAASDMLIRSRPLAQALSRTLGGNAVVLMRGHGATVVGVSLPQVTFRAVYTQVNARLQMDAMRLGTVNFLTAREAAAAAATNDGQVRRAWDLWRHGVAGK